MDYIPLRSASALIELSLWLFPLGGVFGILMAILLVSKSEESLPKKIVFSSGTALGFLAMVGSILPMLDDGSTQGWAPWKAEVTSALAQGYGVAPTEAQFAALQYPSVQPPKLQPVDYGSTVLKFPQDKAPRSVNLHWDGSKMMLTSPDTSGVAQPIPLTGVVEAPRSELWEFLSRVSIDRQQK